MAAAKDGRSWACSGLFSRRRRLAKRFGRGGIPITVPDESLNYGETRFITIGHLDGRMVVTVWTPRAGARRIISLRKANEREQAAYGPRLG